MINICTGNVKWERKVNFLELIETPLFIQQHWETHKCIKVKYILIALQTKNKYICQIICSEEQFSTNFHELLKCFAKAIEQ